MKFGVYLEENLIPEWREFYINFQLLKHKLKPFVKKYKELSIYLMKKNLKTFVYLLLKKII